MKNIWRQQPTQRILSQHFVNSGGQSARVSVVNKFFEVEVTTGGQTHYGVATLSGTGSLSGFGGLLLIGSTTLSGVSTLSGIGRLLLFGSTTLSGTGSLSGLGGLLVFGSTALSGVGTLSGIGKLILGANAVLNSIGTLSAIGRLIAAGKSILTGTGLLSAAGNQTETIITQERRAEMAVRHLSDGNDDGTVFGQSPTDKIGFYGVIPIQRKASAAQAPITDNSGGTVGNVISPITGGATSCTDATRNAIATLTNRVNEIRAVLVELGLMKGSA